MDISFFLLFQGPIKPYVLPNMISCFNKNTSFRDSRIPLQPTESTYGQASTVLASWVWNSTHLVAFAEGIWVHPIRKNNVLRHLFENEYYACMFGRLSTKSSKLGSNMFQRTV